MWVLFNSPLYASLIYRPWRIASGPLVMALGVCGWIPLRAAVRSVFTFRRYPYFLILALLIRRGLLRRRRPRWGTYWRHPAVRMRWLLLGLKAYFLPLMFGSLCHGIMNLAWFRNTVWTVPLALEFVRTVALLADSAVATTGYTFESRRWGSPILAVESSALGWFFCLICYPPANWLPSTLLHPKLNAVRPLFAADSPAALAADACATCLFLLYVAGVIAQGLRFANLTYRGTITDGPYRFVRHPQYAAKLASWFFEWLPYFVHPLNVLAYLGWVGIYVARALTEERFLSRFADYRQYCCQVRWRFVPGVW